MNNMPKIKIGIVAVSRDCFPMSLSENRRRAVVKEYTQKYGEIYECPTCVENEIHMRKALKEVKEADCNALVVYLGNFGPETSETLLAKEFGGPVMFIAASEESGDKLLDDRGDAYCGMLNASYNLKLRNIKAYIPEYPVGTASECAHMIHEFEPIAKSVYGLENLKIISFGPRPQDFLACNAPIKQLYNLGVEIEENSELDLFEAFKNHANDDRIPTIVKEMEAELGEGNKKPEILDKLAQYELTLLDWVEAHKGSRDFVAIAGKCWPAFQTQFGFVPCYVNSRLTAKGIPVSCEVDIYGALSEFIGTVVSNDTVTLLDINNTVPNDMYMEDIKPKYEYTLKDTFMGFHCGNTASNKLSFCEMKYQKIMARSLPEEVTQGTLEGDIVPGDITFFRLQSTSDAKLRAYIAQGEVLPVATKSFGAIGVFAIPEMGRFYRHVLIEKNYPHHGAVAFGHFGKTLYEVFKYLGVCVEEIDYNQPKGTRYKTENPFC
ncbi:L-fucose/L-arabinose isomerase family protein [Terrisporobacter petrolearius]|uniref:L-fucose/L-arabinose isomerase family protein n=1 Tax=Terrisporobacter petrolearius TaxID=1460447 RepID=UPI001D1634FD|nr:L-fucose/L-arabinose isomerase family protein [Terrisporobacter petrolearius]MCC3864788.1 L-fucose/L-arabinose isomerase family protein [Terrisporobacter petrolearius]